MTLAFDDDNFSNDEGYAYAGDLTRFDSFKSQLTEAGVDDDSADIMAGILVDDDEFGIEHRSESDELHAAGCADLINLSNDHSEIEPLHGSDDLSAKAAFNFLDTLAEASDGNDWDDELPQIDIDWGPGMDSIDFANAAAQKWHELGEIDATEEFEIEFDL